MKEYDAGYWAGWAGRYDANRPWINRTAEAEYREGYVDGANEARQRSRSRDSWAERNDITEAVLSEAWSSNNSEQAPQRLLLGPPSRHSSQASHRGDRRMESQSRSRAESVSHSSASHHSSQSGQSTANTQVASEPASQSRASAPPQRSRTVIPNRQSPERAASQTDRHGSSRRRNESPEDSLRGPIGNRNQWNFDNL